MDINFPPALREFLEVWVGASVASGNARDGFDSSRPYYRLSDDIGTMSDAMKSAILTSGDSLPPAVAKEFVAALRLFVDDGGRNHLADFAAEVRTIGDRQVDRSIKLSEARYQILLEFILMNLELALIAALAFFTGGTSLSEIAAVRSRTALSMLLILQRLGHAVPTPLSALLEAIQEAFVTFASQVISMVSPDDPRRRRRDFDWGDIGQSAVAGALAGAFAGIFSGAAAPFFRDLFKKHSPWKDLFELPAAFVNEGQAETFAEAFTKLIFQGTFSLNPATFVSAGTSGLLTDAASTSIEYGGKWLNRKFFQNLDFGQGVNHLPPGGREGSGAGEHAPPPRRAFDTGPDENAYRYDPPADYGVAPVPRPSTASADDAYVAPYDPGAAFAYDSGPEDFASSVGGSSDGSSVFSDGGDVDDVSSVSSVSDYGPDVYGQQGPPIGTGPGFVAKPPYPYDLPAQADGEIADSVFSTLTPQPSTLPGDLGPGALPAVPPPVGASTPLPAFTPAGGPVVSGDQDTERFSADETVREGSVDEDSPASFGEDAGTGGSAPAATLAPAAATAPGGQQAPTPPARPQTSSVESVVSEEVPADAPAADGPPGSAEVAPVPAQGDHSDLRTPPSPEESPRPGASPPTGSEIPPPYRPVPTESQDTHSPAADPDRGADARDDTDAHDAGKGKGRAAFLSELPESLPERPDADAIADAVAHARDEHADALRTYAEANRAAESIRQLPPDAPSSSDTTVLQTATEREEQARGQLENAEARLIQLGADPYDLGPRRGFGSADQVPVVRRDEAARHWIAQHLTAEDLPDNPPALDNADTVTPAELDAAGITPAHLPLTADLLTPLDQVRLLMVRSASWPLALDTVAANASRRIWRTASAEFEGTDSAGGPESASEPGRDTPAARAWDTAVGLVLPLELHPVLADSRYAGDEYRDAVRQVAAHLATEGADHRTAVHVAGRLRHGLGLRARGPGGAPATQTPGRPEGGSPTSADRTPRQPAPATSSRETPATSSPETPPHPLLVGVFGSAIGSSRLYPALRAALDRLDRLRQADPALRDGPLELDVLARRVLLLDPATPVTGAHHGELFRVAMDEAVESAASLAALAAFHLRLRGVLSPTRAVSDPSGFRGRDWTGSPRRDLDLTTTGKVSYRPDGLLERADVRTARWYGPGRPQPYVVTADGAHDHVVVRGFDGAPRRVPIDVFAELLALDPELAALPPDVPVLLLIPGAGDRGLELPRRTADRLGRRLWSANGLVKLSPRRDPALPRGISLLAGPGLRRADWIPSDPGQVPASGTHENAPAWERRMVSHTLVSDNGTIGRGVFDDAEAPAVLEHLSHATEATEHWHRNPATEVWTRDDEPLPFAGKPVYVFAAHGRTGETHVPLDGNTVKIARERETGGMLKRRPSLARLPQEYGILMEECWTAAGEGLTAARGAAPDAFVPDPLATIGKAQHAANETGRTVYGATRGVGLQFLPGRGYVHVSLTDARGRRGRWVEHRPEPTGDALDDRARAAGLHHGPGPATDAVRDRTLRLVRALRLTFGPAVEDESGYGDLLGGIGALEALRAADPVLGGFGPFSLDLFERAARAIRARRSGAGDGDLRPDDFRQVLAEAAGAVHRQPALALGDFADLPHVTGAARRLGGLADPDAEAVRVLGLSGGPAAVGEPERARLFWATVEALEWESRTPDPDVLTAKVLHLDRPDPARRDELLLLVARAAAAGRDPYNPTELAAFHLEVLGAFAPETRLVDPKGVPTGRNWAKPAPNADGVTNANGVTNAKVVTDRAVVAAPAQDGGYRPVSTEASPWTAPGRPAPYLVWAGGTAGGLTLTLPGGFSRPVPYDEIAELLSRDPVLSGRRLDVEVVLAASKVAPEAPVAPAAPTGPGPAATAAPDPDPRAVVSAATGRGVWASRGGASLVEARPNLYVPSLLPLVPGSPAAGDWAAVRPRDLLPGGAPAPLGDTGVVFATPDPASDPASDPVSEPTSDPDPASDPASDLIRTEEPNPEPDPEPAPDPNDPTRPPVLDRALPPPSKTPATPVTFADGRRMPAYVDHLRSLLPGDLTKNEVDELLANPGTFGQSTVAVRGIDAIMRAIADELNSRPDARPPDGDTQLLSDIRQTLREKPKTLGTESGRPFPYVNAKGKVRVFHLKARHYGRWTPFEDGFGHASKIDSMHRGAATFGLTKNMQANYNYGLGAPLGPLSTAAFSGFGRLAFRFGFVNKVGYTLTNARMNQMETRTLDDSRSYLDDAYLEARVTGAVLDPDADRATLERFGFAVRNGLLVRLPDSVLKTARPGRIPASITLDRNSQYRLVRIEGFGPVAAIRDWAAGRVGALPGSTAYAELDTFFSGDSFQRHGGMMARGRVTTPPLFADDDRKSPLGVFVVEELIPRAAVLVGETDKAEMRDINTSTVRSERSRAQGRNVLLQAAAGPAFNFRDMLPVPFDLRLLFGPSAQYGHSRTFTAGLGGAGTLKSAGQVKGPRTALYLVVKSVRVRRAGDTGPPARFLTWSLDRMTSAEARRLAGWDDGTALVLRHGSTPFVPAYLAENRPRTLGMHRVKEFTFDDGLRTRVDADDVGRTLLDAFADSVVNAVAARRRGLVAPLDHLLPPGLPKSWRARFDDLLRRRPDEVLDAARTLPAPPQWSSRAKYHTALQNTLQILGVLSAQNVTANLEALSTVGLRIRLTDPDLIGQTSYDLWVHGTLTGRRYEGKDINEGMRFSAQGIDRLDGQTSAKHGTEVGFEGTFSGRDHSVDSADLPKNTLGVTLGMRKGWQGDAETSFGSTVTNEPMSVSNEPTHLYRYDLALTAAMGGHWRPRGLIRGLGLGLPGLLVLDEPRNVLFGRTLVGDRFRLHGGGAVTGQVLIGVPVQHTPAADPHADGALNLYKAVEPAPVPLTTERALALAKGDLAPPGDGGGPHTARGSDWFHAFQQHPFVIVSVVLSPLLTAEVDRVLETASGGAWQLVKEGAPTREAIVRTFTPQYMAAGFDQSSGPLGMPGTGLLGKGPFGELWATFRYATSVGGMTALTPSMAMDTEMILGGTRQAAGKISRSTTLVFGGQVIFSHGQAPGHGLMSAYGVAANPLSRSAARSLNVVRTVVADMNRKGFTHQVLVAGDVHHLFALTASRVGMGSVGRAAAGSSLVPRSVAGAAGTALTTPGGLLGHLPEKSAHRLGLLDDGLGDVPRYTERLWSAQPWLHGAGFGTYAVNTLDPTEVLRAFERRIARLGLDDASRERIRQLVTARATRALKGEMTSTGPSTMVTVGGWGWGRVRIGDRWVRARVELIPGTPVFEGLDHSAELEENRRAIETVQKNSEISSGPDVGILTTQMLHTGDTHVPAAGVTYTESGSHRKTVASGHSTTTVTIYRAASTEPHAEIVTPYRMRITLEADDTPNTGAPAGRSPESGDGRDTTVTAFDRFRGRDRIVEEAGIGGLREHVPLSLMEPSPSGGGPSPAGPRLPAPDPRAVLARGRAPRPVPVPAVPDKLMVRYGDGVERAFIFPENGFHPRGIIGLENIRVANDLLLTRAYDAGFSLRALEGDDGPSAAALTALLRTTRRTGLTRVGTGSAQALEDGTSTMAVTSFYPRTLEPEAYQLAGLSEKSFLGTDTGQLSLRSTPDFSRALLLTVADGKKLEVLRRYGEIAGTSSADEHTQSGVLGGAFLYDSPNGVGLNQVGLALPGPNDLDGSGMPVGDDHLTSRNLKPKTGRSFLFAVPGSWLSVGDVHRNIVDSRVANRIRGGTVSQARSGPQAMTSEAYVVAWIREDVARELMLITDTNFPERVGKAWDAVGSASKGWVDADKAYWKKRRGAAGLREALDTAQAALDTAVEAARVAGLPLGPARTALDAADSALREARDAAARDHDSARDAVAAARAEVDNHARYEADAEPDHDGWARLLRDEHEAARGRLAATVTAAAALREAAGLRLEAARTGRTEAAGRLAALQRPADEAALALTAATARRDTERDAFEAAAAELRGLREAAERAAAEYHRVRAAADQLTRWHRLAATEEGVRQLDGLEEPPPVTYQAPPRPTPPARPDPPRYTRSGTAPDTVLTSPEQETYTLHDGPRDGDSFFRALAEGLDRADPELLASVGIDLADPNAMPLLRRRLAARLTDPADADLLAFVAPDDTDVFSDGEIGGAGLDLRADTPARREFDALGGLMPYAADLSPEVRAGLAEAQLLRKGDADDGTGWNHSAADLLPTLAARTFGVRITVVGEDGGFQHFTPGGRAGTGNLRGLVADADRDLPQVVLSLADLHYQLAVPTGESTRSGTTTPPVPPPTTDPALSTGDTTASTIAPGLSVDPTLTPPPATLPPVPPPALPLPPVPPVTDTAEVAVTPPPPPPAFTPPAQPPAPPPAADPGATARGRAVRVPRNGECLLYAFMASDPERLRERLGLASVDRAAHDWLGNPDAVHRDLRSHATTWRPRGPWNAVIEAVRGVVAEYVGRSDGVLHPQIAGQFRRTVTDAFAHRVARMDRAELLAHLAHHGVDHVSLPEAFDPDELLRLYVDTRLASEPAPEGLSADDARAEEARAGSLAPRRMFAHVEEQGRLPGLDSLTDGQLRRLLGAVYPQSHAPLDSEELARLLDAVENWESRWETAAGEIFLPLLAHVFDVQVDVVRPLGSGYRRLSGVAGPDSAVRHIEVYYNGSNHYEGSDAAPEVDAPADLAPLDPSEPVTPDELVRAGIELTGARQIHAALLGGAAPLSVADAGLSSAEQALLIRQRAADRAHRTDATRAALDLGPGAFARLLVAALDRDVPHLLGAGPGSATPEALAAWLDSRLAGAGPDAEDRIPGTEPLLSPYEMVSTAQLTSLHIPLALDTYAEASLQGDRISVRAAGLTRTQQFRLLLARLEADAANAAFAEALAALTAYELGVRLALSDAAGGRLLLGPPDGPVVSLDTARHPGTAGRK